MIWRNHHRWENQATWRSVEWPNILLSPFYTFSEQQPKAIENKVCLCQSWSLRRERWKVQKYVLLQEYLKLIVNCSCVQKENAKQKEIIHLVDLRTLQNKAAETIFWILESKIMSISSTGNSVFDEIDNVKCWHIFSFYRNIKFYSKSLKQTSFSTWFDSSRKQICCVKTIIVTSTKNGWSFASSPFQFQKTQGFRVAKSATLICISTVLKLLTWMRGHCQSCGSCDCRESFP